VSGRVTDPAGALIPDVSVTATNIETGMTRTTTTGAGVYQLPLLPPGTYRVEFSAPSFKRTIPPPATVSVTETTALNTQMEVGELQQVLNVAAGADLLQAQSATLGTLIDNRTITSLRLTTRNYTQGCGSRRA
jgi:hypothetical protein